MKAAEMVERLDWKKVGQRDSQWAELLVVLMVIQSAGQ